jgi:hypothetical protein
MKTTTKSERNNIPELTFQAYDEPTFGAAFCPISA